MAITIIGIIIGAMILGAGIYYLAKEKTNREARKIYTITTIRSRPSPGHSYSPGRS